MDGDTAVLVCKLAVPSCANITWYHGSKLLKPCADFDQSFEEESGKAGLAISEIFPDDEGEYKCVVNTKTNQVETKAYLTVKGKFII